jgi:dGTPase
LGHTPFGHAGEDALDNALDKIQWEGKPKHLSRFTHYEHGVDVVSYIDSPNPYELAEGLKLSDWVLEGIFKHTYDHLGIDTKHKSLAFVLDHTKYKKFDKGPGSLEAQVVRICDKLSYFISDIEDGLAIGAIHIDDLMEHELLRAELKHVANSGASGQDDPRIFRQVRNNVLTKLIESLLARSTENLRKTKNRPPIVIALGESESNETKTIYKDLQKDIIFRHFFVDRATKRAKHIVACLFCQFLRHPELIPWSFRRKYLGRVDRYCKRLEEVYNITRADRRPFDISEWLTNRGETEGVDCPGAVKAEFKRRIADLICVKDYVAGMTDRFAEKQFKKCVYCWASKDAWNDLVDIPII